jgi:NitT/TauT family transport system ATP-binding protein
MLEVDGLSQSYGALTVLDRVSFSAREGEFLSLVGPSGCGKTQLLRLIVGLEAPTGGAVRVEQGAPDRPRTAYAFQKSPLFPWLSLYENVRICMSADRRSEAELRAQILSYFRAAGLEGFEKELPWRISGGMRQKVNVIRAFCSGCPLILMDEPFVSLDFPGRQELQQLTLKLWAQEKKTILFVTHDVDEAIQLSNRILVFSPRPGRIVKEIAVSSAYPRDRASPGYAAAFGEIADLLLQGRPA